MEPAKKTYIGIEVDFYGNTHTSQDVECAERGLDQIKEAIARGIESIRLVNHGSINESEFGQIIGVVFYDFYEMRVDFNGRTIRLTSRRENVQHHEVWPYEPEEPLAADETLVEVEGFQFGVGNISELTKTETS